MNLAPFYLGIDLGGTNITAGVLDGQNKLIARKRAKTKAERGSERVIRRIVKLVEEVTAAAELEPGQLGGLGIGAPGVVDTQRGVVIEAVNLRWSNLPLASRLREAVDLPIFVDNDVNVGTWGEYQLGAGRGYQELLGVFVGTGIGGGLVIQGKLYRGSRHSAGEIGHTILNADGPRGRRTLENLASRTAVVDQLRQLIRANAPSQLLELSEGDLDKIRSKALAKAVAAKDPLTLEVLEQAAAYVGTAIANAVTLLSLPCVVLGGGLTEALGPWWVEQVTQAFAARVFPESLQSCRIVPSGLGDDAGVIGAALLARREGVTG